jgi:hypothetical protein
MVEQQAREYSLIKQTSIRRSRNSHIFTRLVDDYMLSRARKTNLASGALLFQWLLLPHAGTQHPLSNPLAELAESPRTAQNMKLYIVVFAEFLVVRPELS